MAVYKVAAVMVLTELVNSDDKKTRRGKTREWIKRRRESGYFQNIFQELKVEDRMGLKDMFRMSVTDYKFVLSQRPKTLKSTFEMVLEIKCWMVNHFK